MAGRGSGELDRSGERWHPGWWWSAAAYLAFLVYGSLYPFVGWEPPSDRGLGLLPHWPSRWSWIDLGTNLVIYAPLGALLVWGSRRHRTGVARLLVVGGLALALSFVLETLQGLLPGRYPSLMDVAANGAGALAGAFVGRALERPTLVTRKLAELRRQWLLPDRLSLLGLAALGAWVVGQWSPLVPSFDPGTVAFGLHPLWRTLRGSTTFDPVQTAAYAATAAAVALVASTLLAPGRPAARISVVLVGLVLAGKVLMETRQLSAEALVGAGAGLAVAALLLRWEVSSRRLGLAALGLVAAFLLEGLRVPPGPFPGPLRPMSWIPLASHRLDVGDLADFAGQAWPFLGLGYLARRWLGESPGRRWIAAGAAAAFALGLAVELVQLRLPGRTPDATDALVALLAWLAAWTWPRRPSGS